MINVFISSLIALFFLGKTSKETREKTARSSRFRTGVYLLLTIIFGIVFYKSNQVSTIVNIVDLRCLRGAEDSLHNSLDTVMYVDIYNHFEAMGSYKNDYENLQHKYTNKNQIEEYGGVYASMKRNISDQDRIITREHLFNFSKYKPLNDSIKKYIGKDISQVGPIYELSLLTTNIPNFIPLFPDVELPLTWDSDDGLLWFSFIANNTRNSKILDVSFDGEKNDSIANKVADEKLWDNGTYFQITSYLSDINIHRYFKRFDVYGHFQLANTVNFFTAADLSQYSYVLMFKSDMPVNCLKVIYNIPIEITNVGEGFSVGANYFTLYDQEFLNAIRREGHPLYYHVKLPTMANLQEIRSLVLTALVTTFFSLFCTNLFYCLRKRALKYRLLHLQRISNLKRISKRRVKFYRYFHYMLVLLLLSFILFVVCMSCLDKTLLVNFDYLEYKIVAIFLLITAVFLFTSYRLYKYTITPLSKKRGKDKIKEREDNKNK